MELDDDAFYAALSARDPRFDGLFFVGVRSTGVYCRPICPARLPRRENCTFHGSAAEAERAGYRACLRCRPELAPGDASVDARSRLVRTALARIHEGFLDRAGVSDLSDTLGVTDRHLRRVLKTELGVSPVDLAQTRRLALAKQLLQDTRLPVTQVAYTAGFSSLRRFNAAFKDRFERSPSTVRGRARSDTNGADAGEAETITLRLDYRPPFAWDTLLAFFRARATRGVEAADGMRYRRWVALDGASGWVEVENDDDRPRLRTSIPHGLLPHVSRIVAGIRNLFDLDARPELIDEHLRGDPRLGPLVSARPGLRVPGAFDPFELAVRAVLGQQISVAAATTLCGRMVARLAQDRRRDDRAANESREAGRGTHPGIAFPSPEELAGLSVEYVGEIGMPRSRARTVVELARSVVDGTVDLDPTADPETASRALRSVPGIGPWTAQYILMRALRWPNAFPASDLGLLRALGTNGTAETLERAQAWEPWRAYGAMHLWNEPSSGES